MTWQARRRRLSACLGILLLAAVCIRLHSCIRIQNEESGTAAGFSAAPSETQTDAPSETSPPVPPETDEPSLSVPLPKEIPGGFLIEGVPHIPQSERYPTGCESVSAVALLEFYDVKLSVETFIDQYLPTTGYPYCGEDGVLYGESPWEAFIGDPYSTSGYGCYSTAIVKALKAAAPQDISIHSISQASLELLCQDYIAQGHPVMIWATMYMKAPYEGNSWVLPNGEVFQFICPEHALLLIGYDAQSYYFSDPLSEEAVTAYPREACETAYAALYSQAIAVQPDR